MINLRKYQKQGVDTIREKSKDGHKQIIWCGATGCISGNSIINFNRAKKGFSMQIEKAYKHFNGFAKYSKWNWDKSIKTYVRSLKNGKILLHEIDNIVYSGEKEVFNLKLENGFCLELTEDHEVMTKNGFRKLKHLNNKSMIMIDENKAKKSNNIEIKTKDKYKSVGKHHPYSQKHHCKKRGRTSYTIEIHRFIYEAHINGLSLDQYKKKLDSGNLKNIKFINTNLFVIHHKDFNHFNNKISNLVKLTHSQHNIVHKKYNNFGYGDPTYSRFLSIKKIGIKKTYDIICKDPFRNFVANKIVIHNSGKTVIGADITAKANANRKRVLWLVHRQEILEQTIKKLVLFGINPGIIQGHDMMSDSLTHVAMVQTLSNRLDFMAKNYILPDIIISDEAHHGVANTWLKIFDYVKRYKKQSLTIGLTATPQRTDGIGLSSAGYTCLINGPQYPDLINPAYTGGDIFLSEPVVFYSPLTFELSRAKSKKKRKDFDPTSEEKIFGERIVINNCVDMYNKYFFGSPCIIFCASVNDCMEVSAAMNAAGWRGGAVYDKMDSEERRDYISGLGDGRYQFLCSYDILGEGVDIPVTAGCILRRRTTSIIIYLQQVGRSARKYPGKKYNLIIDQCGNSIPGIMHGHPLTRRHWTLEGIVKEQGEQELKMTICEGCGAHIAGKPSVCPYCGSSLRSVSEFTEKTIKEVEAPMSVLPAPAQTGYNDISEIEEFEVKDREKAIIDRIRSGHMNSFDRFGELAKMIGKDQTWVNLIWRKYYNV